MKGKWSDIIKVQSYGVRRIYDYLRLKRNDLDDNMLADLCVEAFQKACRDDNAKGMILHSDRGAQFASKLFRKALKKANAI